MIRNIIHTNLTALLRCQWNEGRVAVYTNCNKDNKVDITRGNKDKKVDTTAGNKEMDIIIGGDNRINL